MTFPELPEGWLEYQPLSMVLAKARKLGIKCTPRTFWRYHELGLLPKGRKMPGYGNVVYFPPSTEFSLWWIEYFSKELQIPLIQIADMLEARLEDQILGFHGYVNDAKAWKAYFRKLRGPIEKKYQKIIRGAYEELATDLADMLADEGAKVSSEISLPRLADFA